MTFRRILVLGSSGAGKSTFATELAKRLELPLIHLDAHYWLPGWIEPPKDEWKRRVLELASGDAWVMDGNYGGTIADRVPFADTVIVLDLPRIQCLYRVVRRAIKYRGRTRPDLNDGCPEKLPHPAFIAWIWNYPKRSLPKVLAALRHHEATQRTIILRSSRDVREFLDGLRRP